MKSLEDLLAQRDALDRQIEEAKRDSRQAALEEIRRLMKDNALTSADIVAKGVSGLKGSRKKVEPKYRDPSTGATWSGRGLKPTWLSQHLAEGKALQDFAIQMAVTAVDKKPERAANLNARPARFNSR